ncbi:MULTISPECIES: 16S rRNA (adenine(1518)-N(6)/adenine(1519)-N(6))-dimethyltransferase RsmA [unclassified Thermosynechococcus]|uniref:16S rRNA (adenine(1518)-N(6)/adenine(1519)-N(6))- dimethyltransferase RsmA n=1 Tax=unclassified Thermosynechococcus TaxID=2622553 RepID=UPI0028F4596E|nr:MULTISPECIES: 16S rRNA (adenine(1518)-N(6)/adenine(1519)-N(6))-dimethyltransferase RsmA [unclassified Thermosynechococcus]
MRARKRFGQHWLRSESVLAQIIAAAELHAGDRILEIGPGRGALTRPLLASGAEVVAVELDRDLCGQLQRQFGSERFQLIAGDILRLDLAPLGCNKVVANIPYNITGPLLGHLLGSIARPHRPAFERLILLVQKEIGDRLMATPGSKAYGALSVRVQFLATCEKVCAVPPRAFQPPPKVDSVVICLRPHATLPRVRSPQWLETLLKQGFATRRKMLANALKSLVEPDQVRQALLQLGRDVNSRAEALSLEDWLALSELLQQPHQDQQNPQPTTGGSANG